MFYIYLTLTLKFTRVEILSRALTFETSILWPQFLFVFLKLWCV